MELVGSHLKSEAINRLPRPEADLFGRTAFNRFYYATYLEVRRGLAEMRHEWAGDMPHAAIPEILRGTIKKELSKGKQQAQKLDDQALVKRCASATSAALDLAKLLDEGRSVRVTADYHPEILIDFAHAPDFQLNSVPVNLALSWPHRARTLMQAIADAWKQLHG